MIVYTYNELNRIYYKVKTVTPYNRSFIAYTLIFDMSLQNKCCPYLNIWWRPNTLAF